MEKYVLKTNEAVLVPIRPPRIPPIVRKIVLGIWVAILVFSLVFGENLLSEMNGIRVALLIALSLCAFLDNPKKEYVPSEMELQFHKDKLVLYRPKRYYDERVTRREFCEMKYADITSCVFEIRSGRIHIYGDGVTTWYNMKKDGTFPDKPTKVKHFKEGLLFFSTKCAQDVDFADEIESHSPLHVSIENS